MTRIRVDVTIDAPPDEVWSTLEDVEAHVEWMADAEAIRFRGDQTSGVGTEIECDTRIGPFTTTDVMRFTEWEPGRRMGVAHSGVVSGEGRFELHDLADGCTRFVWDEELSFPHRLGGPVAEALARPVIRRVWRRNLRRLKRIVESGWG